uniref:Calcitonin-1-like n=1 Tax=Petromyzon marinus TaxID=7757 RepID=A0AAJ7WZS7_PETMA|nr:calcitonin-1-like [Petromyzon marinus]
MRDRDREIGLPWGKRKKEAPKPSPAISPAVSLRQQQQQPQQPQQPQNPQPPSPLTMSPRHASLLLACLVLSARLSGSRAAPPRLILEQGGPPGVAGRLLGALVSGYLRPAGDGRGQQQQRDDEEEGAQWESEPLGWDGSPERDLAVSKRCAGLSTCILADLTDKLHRLSGTRTNVGVGTPGRKRRAAPSSSSSSPAGISRGGSQGPGEISSPSFSSSSSLKPGSLPPRAV